MALLPLELAFLLLLFFLPGYFLMNAVFPRPRSLGGDLDPLYRVFGGVLLSVSLGVLYGSVLVVAGSFAEEVLFRPATLWPGLALLTALLFVLGAIRGAYPRLRRGLGLPAPEAEAGPVEEPPFDRLVDLASELEEAERALRTAQGGEADRLAERVEAIREEKRRLEVRARERV